MSDQKLTRVWHRISISIKQDQLIQTTTDELREYLNVDRLVLYYFYACWEGRVTFESLKQEKYSIYGSTGPDESFNGEYAAMYKVGRISAIQDICEANISECHREFLQKLEVKANLVVPILNNKGLWGLLIAHHCQHYHSWSDVEIKAMKIAAAKLAQSPSISNN